MRPSAGLRALRIELTSEGDDVLFADADRAGVDDLPGFDLGKFINPVAQHHVSAEPHVFETDPLLVDRPCRGAIQPAYLPLSIGTSRSTRLPDDTLSTR